MYTKIKTESEIESMRKAGKICAQILGLLCKIVEPGMSTKDLAEITAKEIKKAKADASFLGYSGFPSVICISVNEEVVHGIPTTSKIIKKDDIVSFDLGITCDGMIVDSARSCIVGQGNDKTNKLLKETEKSLMAGISVIKSGCKIGDISYAIEKVLKAGGYGIVRDLVGHGVGHEVHEEPNIPNYGNKGSGPVLKTGMTIAVEPMATLGSHDVYVDKDGWTIKTRDLSLSAHFEHTILVTDKGFEILTSL